MRRADRPLKDHVTQLVTLLTTLSQEATPSVGKGVHEALELLIKQMHNDPVPAYIPSLIVMLGAPRDIAQIAAQTLVTLAETNPTPALQDALEPLQKSMWASGAPLAFFKARRSIQHALKRDLPIPATAPEMLVADLPLPVQSFAEDDANDG